MSVFHNVPGVPREKMEHPPHPSPHRALLTTPYFTTSVILWVVCALK